MESSGRKSKGGFRFAIDRGGTFTDVFAHCPNGKIRVLKLLSSDPENYNDAPTEGIRRILEEETGRRIPRSGKIDASDVEWIRMGTTVATNALLERQGERMALLLNKGLKDVIFIGNQARPKLFDLEIKVPPVLYEEVVEVDGKVILSQEGICQLDKQGMKSVTPEKTLTGEGVHVFTDLDEQKLRKDLAGLLAKGVTSIAVALMHSYTYPDHELRIAQIASEMGFGHISLSHQVMPMVRIVPRGFTACVDAYLTPCIKRYLDGFCNGFENNLKNVSFMQSDGGLIDMANFNGSRAILSGPAGGVVGYAKTAYGDNEPRSGREEKRRRPVIGFDMGGTSTDVSRYGGAYEHVFETTTAGVTIQAPQLDISTVAAGGGSRLFFRAGLFAVGPESAGAHPGPVCYRKGGHLTITDANLVLGRLLPDHFPKIFGPNEDQPLDKESAVKEFEKLTAHVNDFLRTNGEGGSTKPMSIYEVAMGFVRVADETMCRPIRNLTVAKGHDTRDHVLACFGGAGGQHACSIAASLGMDKVFVHKYAGILSAYGIALADVVHEEQVPCALEYTSQNIKELNSQLHNLKVKSVDKLMAQGFPEDLISVEYFLHMRYRGTDCALMCPMETTDTPEKLLFGEVFVQRYKREFGFLLQNRSIVVDDVRVRAVGKTKFSAGKSRGNGGTTMASRTPEPKETARVFFKDQHYNSSVYIMEDLEPGDRMAGPCIVMDKLSTVLVEPGSHCDVTSDGDLEITLGASSDASKRSGVSTELDMIQLSIFSHRFMSIAEQMGGILQRTSISTNIKERLDFSCALFGPDGGLISNAPHIPVHLGAMQSTVRYQMTALAGQIHDGDVILANHPKAGGSHLPDLTVITPVFYGGASKPVFFVANRGHHADIGGITPGSMPPHSKHLYQEGATFKSFKVVDRGAFQESALVKALLEDPAKFPGCSGTRTLQENISDLKAQIAANNKGIRLVSDLIEEYGLDVVQAYMKYIQENAEVAVREMLKKCAQSRRRENDVATLSAEDYMDDGSKIALQISIDHKEGTAVFDFGGTSPQVWGNINAPRAVTMSAIIYCLRCLVGQDIPLNQGCMNPIKVVIPEGSILDPSEGAAVVGGNVLTSQRTVDVILKAFEACSASQGCCNNITFGDDNFGYYETVAGGSGAGPGWNGRSGVHVHMTNTRLTDPEILERRYPVVLEKFCLAEGTGGEGQYRGGDGVERRILFRKPLSLSVLTERRVIPPYGMNGGQSGQRGLNTLMRKKAKISSGQDEAVELNLGAKCAVEVEAGDTFVLRTPGGGGWGKSPQNIR